MGRGIRAPVFFSAQAFGIEVKPVSVRRAVAAFQHMVKLPETARTVVENTIQDNAHIPFVCLLEQFVERLLPAEQGVDSVKIKGMVAVVSSGGKDRIQIQRGDAQILQIVQLFGDPIQVAALKAVHSGGGIPRLEEKVSCGVACAFCKTIRKNLV